MTATLSPLLPLEWSATPQEDGSFVLRRAGWLAAHAPIRTEWRVGPNALERRTRVGRWQRAWRITDATLRLYSIQSLTRIGATSANRVWRLDAHSADGSLRLATREITLYSGFTDPTATGAELQRCPELSALAGWLAAQSGWRLSAR